MILGTSRGWWIFAGILFVLGLALVATSAWDTLGDVAGVALVIIAMIVFAAAPQRYGRQKPGAAPRDDSLASAGPVIRDGSVANLPPVEPAGPPPPRAEIDARDASEV